MPKLSPQIHPSTAMPIAVVPSSYSRASEGDFYFDVFLYQGGTCCF